MRTEGAPAVDDFYRGWLAAQCRRIPGISGGVVFGVGPAGRQAAPPLAVWGGDEHTIPSLATVAERAAATGRRIVMRHDVDSRRHWAIAFPVQAEGHVVATVALDLAPRPANDVLRILHHLEGGASWLEALAR